MTKKCETQQPYARIRLHSPTNGWRRHVDKTVRLKGPTDFDMWAGIAVESLRALGYTQPPFIVGFMLDMVNRLPDEMRRMVAAGILQGWGTEVEVEDDGITVKNVPKYNPLVGEQKTDSGIVLPDGARGESGLVLPKSVQ